MASIRIRWPAGEVLADLDSGPTTERILAVLPRDSTARTWGEEVYFTLPVRAQLEPGARQVVDPGAVCFWVEGSALALPWGRTPASLQDECRLVSPCSVLGRIRGDATQLRSVRDGDAIRVEAA